MSKSTRVFLFASIVAVALQLNTSGFPQAPPQGTQETVLTFIHDFLQVFYPDVIAKGNQLVLCVSHPADATWREISGVYFKVAPFSTEEPNPLTDLNGTSTLLGGSFWLTPQKQYGRIFRMLAFSDLVHEKQLNAVRKLVETHPGWSEPQVIQALKAAGVRYGPQEKQEFLSSLHLDKAERFLGKLTIKTVDFNGFNADDTSSVASGSLEWVVRAKAQFPDGTTAEYGLTFEPFESKLVNLSRH